MRPRVVIVGGGFGGVEAAKSLKGVDVDVLIIDRKNHHLFQPLLYQVATAGLSPANIAWPIRSIFRAQKNVDTMLGEVTGVDTDAKEVVLGDRRVSYDYLILATGVTHGWFGHPEWAEHVTGLKELEEATSIRNEILSAYEEADKSEDAEVRKAFLTFAVIGGGPTGVELAGSLAELASRILPDDYRRVNPRDARVVLIEAGPRLLSTFDPSLSSQARRDLEELGVEVWMNRPVTEINEKEVRTQGEVLPTRSVFWAAGVAGTPVGEWLGVETDRMGRVKVTEQCEANGFENVFVIGDVARFMGPGDAPLPGVATVAIQQGAFVARLIKDQMAGKTVFSKFEYKDPGSMATIGRKKAVVQVGETKFRGILAWLMWLFVHLIKLMSFRNKVLVFVQWIWAYFTYQRGARLITQTQRDCEKYE